MSASLKELLSWRLVKVAHVMGDRKDYFETSKDIWELFRLIVEGRKQREVEPTLAVLKECLASPELGREATGTRQRIEQTLDFMDTLTRWSDEMLRVPPETLLRILKLGARIQKLLRDEVRG